MTAIVREAAPADDAAITAFVRAQPGATPFHLPAWSRAVERGCGQRARYLVAERDRAMLARLVEALRSDTRIDREQLARNLRQTVLHLVTRLVGETGVSGALLAARVNAATDLLADAAESAILRVNPADIALLEGHLPDTVFAAGDAGVARGSFVMEAASTIVEDGPELWLEQLARTLDKVALPDGDAH